MMLNLITEDPGIVAHLDGVLQLGDLDDMLDALILRAIQKNDHNVTQAAKALGIGRATIYRHIERLKKKHRTRRVI